MSTPEEHLRTVSEGAGFIRTVATGMYCKTGEDVDDGFGNFIESCRECTLSRTHQDSEAQLWLHKYTDTGPVLDVKIICHHNVHGIENLIPSTSGGKTKVWVVKYRSSTSLRG